ncbi:MAG: HNH endonuclease [Pyrinomonadaceae bacterium]
MSVCLTCGREISFLGSVVGFFKGSKLCKDCQESRNNALQEFRTAVLINLQNASLQKSLEPIYAKLKKENVSKDEAWAFFLEDALHFLEKIIVFNSASSFISEDSAKYFYWLVNIFQLPPQSANPLIERFKRFKSISDIRQGNLPTVVTNIHLDSDEICRLAIEAVYHKVNLRSVRTIPGRFIVTNKKIHFLSSNGGWTILWKNVMRVQIQSAGIYLELATKNGNGYYSVYDPLFTEAIITTLTRMYKRQMLIPQTESQTRHIAQDIKSAVWQRDQGKCVQCGAMSYLEFDHIIPFSKGGANSINNVQLLCRNCNSKKGNKI